MKNHLSIANLTLAAALCATGTAWGQVAGSSTTSQVSATESTRVATGRSVKKTLLGKTIYNDAGLKVGKVDDVVISRDTNASYVIVGVGGFVGLGQHDVAVPIAQIQDQKGKLVLPGATPETMKSLPGVDFSYDATRRKQFVAAAEQDIAHGNTKLIALEKKAGVATTEARAKLDVQITTLQDDVKSAQTSLTELKEAAANRWKDFEAGVGAATDRLRKAVDSATG